MPHDHIELSAYLDGELTRPEQRRLEARLASDPAYARELGVLARAQTALGAYTEETALRDALMGRIRKHEAEYRRALWRRRSMWAASAALILFSMAVLMNQVLLPRLNRPGDTRTAAAPPQVTRGELPPSEKPDFAQTAPPEAPLEDTTPPGEALACSAASFEILGTVTGSTPMAIIAYEEDGRAQSGTFAEGDEVIDGVTLVEVRQGQVILDDHGERVELTIADREVQDPLARFEGVWETFIVVNGQERQTDKVVVRRQDERFAVASLTLGKSFMLDAHVAGLEVALMFESNGLMPQRMEGAFSSDFKTIDAITILGPDGQPPDATSEAAGLFRMKWAAPLDADGAQVQTEQECVAEAKAMFEILERYALDHEKHHPDRLEDLLPGYAPDLSLFEDSQDRTVQYYPGNIMNRRVVKLPPPEFEPLETYPGRLLALEEALARGGQTPVVFRKRLLQITHQSAQLEVFVDPDGWTVTLPLNLEALAQDADSGQARLAGMRETCQNNLKELGACLMGFAQDHQGYLPGGWLSMCPFYNDSGVGAMRSPIDPPGTESYIIVLPATNVSELAEEMAGAGDAAEVAGVRHALPMVIQRNDWPGPRPGRNVLFADGHVEFILTDTPEWRQHFLPYLQGR